MTRLELVQRKHAAEQELRELQQRERVNVEVLRAALDVIAKHEPATGLCPERLRLLLAEGEA